MFKKLEARLDMINRNIKNIKNTEFKFLEMKIIISEVKSTLNGTKNRVNIAEK